MPQKTARGNSIRACRFRNPHHPQLCTGCQLAPGPRNAYSLNMAKADCQQCSGTGWRIVENPAGNDLARRFAAGDATRVGSAVGEPKTAWAVPCDCTETDRHSRILERARLPRRYTHCNFESYDTDLYDPETHSASAPVWNHSLTQAKLVVQGFARGFPVGTEHGLMLMGPCGVGKTHLAVAALAEIALRGHSALFYDYRELLKEIQDSYNPESNSTEMSVLEPVLKAEVLLLDDLGSSRPSLWALETVGHILNARYNDSRMTILTTNFLDAPTKLEDKLEDRVGVRIRSRLYEMCETVELNGLDYRKEVRKARHFHA